MPRRVAYSFVALDKFTAISERIKRKTQGIRRQFRSLAGDAAKAGRKIKDIGTKLRGFSLAATGAILGSAKAFGDVEKGITNVLTLLDKPDIDAYGGKLTNLAKDAMIMGFSIDDSNKALFDNVSALGLSESSMDAYEVAQKLAIGGVTELSVAVDGITSVMNAYGKETTVASDVANAFFTAQKAGKTTVAKLAQTVGAVAPMAKTAGVGFKELLATMSQLTLGGLSTEESAVALKGVLTSLLKPGAEAEKILTELGVPFGATGIRAAGLAGTLAEVAKISEKYPDLLARAIPNIRGFTAAAALGADEIANIGTTVSTIDRDIRDGTGWLAAYEMQMGTFSQETSMAWGAIKVLASEFGEALAPVMRIVTKGIVFLIEKMRGLKSTTKKFIAWIVAAAALISPVLIAVGTIMTILGKGALFLGAVGGFLISWPVLIAAAIAAAIALIIQHFDWIAEKWDVVKNKVKGWLGIEGTNNPELQSQLELETSSKSQIDVNLNAPKGTVESVKTKTVGPTIPNIGVNMAEAR